MHKVKIMVKIPNDLRNDDRNVCKRVEEIILDEAEVGKANIVDAGPPSDIFINAFINSQQFPNLKSMIECIHPCIKIKEIEAGQILA